MQYSEYQKQIFNWIENGSGDGAAIAVAGSSKTTTAIKGLDYINPMFNVRFNCFNNIIKDELARKTNHLRNVQVSTYNAFGWRVCGSRFGRIKLDKNKTDIIFKYNVSDQKLYYKYRYIMSKLVGLCKGMACLTTEEAMSQIDQIINHHAMDIKDIDVFKELFAETYELVINQTQVMDFDDQLFMPIRYDLPIPKTDFLIVDEWQDTNLIQYELVKRSIGHDGRILVIGDPDQSIYGFRGTAPDIVKTFIEEMNAKKLPLYICYRCPKAAVRNAQQWVPHIEPWNEAKEGVVDSIKKDKFQVLVCDQDMVLCRCTAPLIESCLSLIGQGRKAYVRGRDMADGLVKLIESFGPINSETFYDRFKAYVVKQRQEYEKYEKETALQLLEDQSDIIDVLIVGTQMISDLIKKINSLFVKDKGEGICHMTIHKSKGLESTGNVFSLPYKMGKLKRDWMIEEERRLKYVEATRTRNNHYYVT